MTRPLNYHHLHCFWVVAQAGGMSRGAEQLGLAVQTVSAQVRALERQLGLALLKPAGRGLALTAAGQAALRQADQIFQLGAALPSVVNDAVSAPRVRLAVGVSDGLAKLVVHRLLKQVLATPQLQLQCDEGGLDVLLAALALHRLDLVLADRPAPPNPNLRLYSHALGATPIACYAPPELADAARRAFPHSLAGLPWVLPSPQGAVRQRLDRWFEGLGLRPRIVGEFDDSALLKTFGAAGMGVFPAAEIVQDEIVARYGVVPVGRCDGVEEHFFAIGTEKKVQHPLVRRLLSDREAAATP